MPEQDIFSFKLDLLRDEINDIQNRIAGYDDLAFKIKGWAVTLWIAVLGFSFSEKEPLLPFVGFPVLIAFWFLDAFFKSYQQRCRMRMGYIENFINNSGEGSTPSLAEAFQKRSFGSFVLPDPVGRQTSATDEAFKEEHDKRTSFWRNLVINNVALLYLFLLLSNIVAIFAIAAIGSD